MTEFQIHKRKSCKVSIIQIQLTKQQTIFIVRLMDLHQLIEILVSKIRKHYKRFSHLRLRALTTIIQLKIFNTPVKNQAEIYLHLEKQQSHLTNKKNKLLKISILEKLQWLLKLQFRKLHF
jgi:argonaute-like protein implicated in RNA metabolism and viral defense